MIRALLISLALAASATHAQQSTAKRIGYFSASSAAVNAERLDAFRRGMMELGWVESRDFVIEMRYANAVQSSVSKLVADVVASRPDLVLTPSDEGARQLAKATKTIPIVFATATDPLGFGLVSSLQHPGGNLTGLVTLRAPLGAKRLQLLKESFPHVAHIAVLYPEKELVAVPQLAEIENAATRLGIRVTRIGISEAKDIDAAVKRAAASGSHAYVVTDGFLINTRRRQIVEAIRSTKLPAIFARAEIVEAGGLMSYAASNLDNFRRSAAYVDKILKGAKPGDLPIEQPTKFELVVNLKTAKAMGITLPTSLLLRADKVIE